MYKTTNKDLLYTTGNYIQYPVIKPKGKRNIYIYIYESFDCTAETNTLQINYTSIKILINNNKISIIKRHIVQF